jgi:hypothetical protein
MRRWFAAVAVLCAVSCGEASPATSSPAAPDTAAAAPSPQVLLDLKGSGDKTTQAFTAAGNWDLQWTYDCKAALTLPDGMCDLFIHIKDASGDTFGQNQGVSQQGQKDQGVEHYHVGGNFYLEISTCCVKTNWTVKVIG